MDEDSVGRQCWPGSGHPEGTVLPPQGLSMVRRLDTTPGKSELPETAPAPKRQKRRHTEPPRPAAAGYRRRLYSQPFGLLDLEQASSSQRSEASAAVKRRQSADARPLSVYDMLTEHRARSVATGPPGRKPRPGRRSVKRQSVPTAGPPTPPQPRQARPRRSAAVAAVHHLREASTEESEDVGGTSKQTESPSPGRAATGEDSSVRGRTTGEDSSVRGRTTVDDPFVRGRTTGEDTSDCAALVAEFVSGGSSKASQDASGDGAPAAAPDGQQPPSPSVSALEVQRSSGGAQRSRSARGRGGSHLQASSVSTLPDPDRSNHSWLHSEPSPGKPTRACYAGRGRGGGRRQSRLTLVTSSSEVGSPIPRHSYLRESGSARRRRPSAPPVRGDSSSLESLLVEPDPLAYRYGPQRHSRELGRNMSQNSSDERVPPPVEMERSQGSRFKRRSQQPARPEGCRDKKRVKSLSNQYLSRRQTTDFAKRGKRRGNAIQLPDPEPESEASQSQGRRLSNSYRAAAAAKVCFPTECVYLVSSPSDTPQGRHVTQWQGSSRGSSPRPPSMRDADDVSQHGRERRRRSANRAGGAAVASDRPQLLAARTRGAPPTSRASDGPPAVDVVDSPPLPAAVDSPPLAAAVDSPPLPAAVDSPPLPAAVDSSPLPAAVDSPPLPAAVDSPPLAAAVDSPPLPAAVDSPASGPLGRPLLVSAAAVGPSPLPEPAAPPVTSAANAASPLASSARDAVSADAARLAVAAASVGADSPSAPSCDRPGGPTAELRRLVAHWRQLRRLELRILQVMCDTGSRQRSAVAQWRSLWSASAQTRRRSTDRLRGLCSRLEALAVP